MPRRNHLSAGAALPIAPRCARVRVLMSLVSLLITSCGGGSDGSMLEPVHPPLTFTASSQLDGKVSQAYSYSFCEP